MTDQDRCNKFTPHPAHSRFGLKDCPGVPMTSREELRAERVTTGRLEGDLRSQTRAVREALAERDEARRRNSARADALMVISLVLDTTDEDTLRLRIRDAIEQCDRALATPDPADDEDAVQNLLDDSTRAFAAADTSSERVEVIRDLLDGWYAHWPKTAVTDPHEGIAWQLASLISAAEARASAPSSVPPRRAQEDDLSDRLAGALAAVMRSHTGADVSVASWVRWEALLAEHAEREG